MHLRINRSRAFVPALGAALLLVGSGTLPAPARGQALYSYAEIGSSAAGWPEDGGAAGWGGFAERFDSSLLDIRGGDWPAGTASAQVQTNFGYTRIAASTSGGDWGRGWDYYGQAFCLSRFSDLLTVHAAAAACQVRYRFQVANLAAGDYVMFTAWTDGSQVVDYFESAPTGTDVVVSDSRTVAPGQAFAFIGELAGASTGFFFTSEWSSLNAQVSLVGLEILDAQGEPMADAWISSASGTTYANLFGAAAAPEPGTLALCGIALAGGIRWLRRRAR